MTRLVIMMVAVAARIVSDDAEAFHLVAAPPNHSQQQRDVVSSMVSRSSSIEAGGFRMQPLFMSTKEAEASGGGMESSSPQTNVEFSDEEEKMIEELHAKATDAKKDIQKFLEDALPNLPPKLVLKLRQAEKSGNKAISNMATELNQLLELRMKGAKEILQSFLQAGEIRKLDNLIGQAAKKNQLDVAFFNVLSYNLKDAAVEASQEQSSGGDGGDGGEGGGDDESPAASRLQILQHIYTRCQEEVEKSIPPGSTLLNKLLRTSEESIRANLYRHYLIKQETSTIVTPDGKKVELQNQAPGGAKALVSIDEFSEAIARAVEQIRTVEQANGMDKVSAANMVETCRQIAKEARLIVGEAYGVESDELKSFEDSLFPVFRPASPESPYIKGTD